MQTVPQRLPGGGKTAVTELVVWSLDLITWVHVR